MTASNGNIFRVTGPLRGETTGHRWIPLTKASDAELWWSAPEHTVEQTIETVVIWDAIALIMTSLWWNIRLLSKVLISLSRYPSCNDWPWSCYYAHGWWRCPYTTLPGCIHFATVYGRLVNRFYSPHMWIISNYLNGFSAVTSMLWECPCTWFVSIGCYQLKLSFELTVELTSFGTPHCSIDVTVVHVLSVKW